MAFCAKVHAILLVSSLSFCDAAPLKGSELAPSSDNVGALNEPCYVHDSACDGYPVCCVTRDTCISMHSGTVSSNTAYYEGGCQSFASSKKDWNRSAGCTQQGECLVQHLEVCMGATTKSGFMVALPDNTADRLMTGSCGASCPAGGYGHRRAPPTGTTTTTTTTTIMYHAPGVMDIDVSGDASKFDGMDKVQLEEMLSMAIAAMAGDGVSHSDINIDAITSDGMKRITKFTVSLSSNHKVAVEDAAASALSMSMEQMTNAINMYMGKCDFTLAASSKVCMGTMETCRPPEPMSKAMQYGSSVLVMILVAMTAM